MRETITTLVFMKLNKYKQDNIKMQILFIIYKEAILLAVKLGSGYK